MLTPAQILERLSQRLDLFKGGRDADPRQQTLRATIAWCYDLLAENERHLFARLSVFAGGCTLEAAEEVCDADLDTLQSLVEKSLLRCTDGRYWMLETIREFAPSSSSARVTGRVCAGVTPVLRRACGDGRSRAPGPSAGALDAACFEQDTANVRAALGWCAETRACELATPLISAAGFVWPFWDEPGRGRASARRIRAHVRTRRPPALRRSSWPQTPRAMRRSERARGFDEERLELCRALGDRLGEARTLSHLSGVVVLAGDTARAESLLLEA